MSKKIYIRVDKPIEVGDLVRCIEDDSPCRVGDIRKVESPYRYLDTFVATQLFITTQLFIMCRKKWEVVHKLKVGDKVVGKSSGLIYTVETINPSGRTFTVENGWCFFRAPSDFELYQPKKHDPKPTLGVDYSKEQSFSVTIDRASANALCKTLGIPTAYEVMDNRIRQEFMKAKVAEMIVELMDRDATKRGLLLTNYRTPRETVIAHSVDNEIYKATLSPNDTWDTLTGVYVALSKATGRKLPGWIYGDQP